MDDKEIEKLMEYMKKEWKEPHIKPTNKIVLEHLRARAEKLGHRIKEKDLS